MIEREIDIEKVSQRIVSRRVEHYISKKELMRVKERKSERD